jgi:HEAT repeat protein
MPNSLKDLLGPLSIALKDAVPEVQVAAADAFANLLAEDETAIPALTFALKNPTSRVKNACMVALDAYGPERVALQLVKHLVGREDWMLQTIAKVSARMAEVLVPALGEFAKRGDASLVARENAVRVIGDLGQKARVAEPYLVDLLPEMEGMLAAKAAFSLGAVARPSKELIDAMLARLQVDPRPSLHFEIRQAVKILKRRMPASAA